MSKERREVPPNPFTTKSDAELTISFGVCDSDEPEEMYATNRKTAENKYRALVEDMESMNDVDHGYNHVTSVQILVTGSGEVLKSKKLPCIHQEEIVVIREVAQ